MAFGADDVAELHIDGPAAILCAEQLKATRPVDKVEKGELSVTTARDSGELHEILVDRISPQDVNALKGFDGAQSLKGIGFGHFAGFFSRAYRENDYLLGRLHALERLMDIVCDTARIELKREGFDVLALKKRAFTRILDAEEPHLPNSKALIAAIRRCIAEIQSP